MKIRNGFVSNSSTSSFLIYGTVLSDDDLEKRGIDIYAVDELVDIEAHSPYDDDWFIGVSWSKVKDDQTGAQFKAEVRNRLIEILGDGLTFDTHKYAWRDG